MTKGRGDLRPPRPELPSLAELREAQEAARRAAEAARKATEVVVESSRRAESLASRPSPPRDVSKPRGR